MARKELLRAILCITALFIGIPITGALLFAEYFFAAGAIGTLSLYGLLRGVGATYEDRLD